MPDNEEVVPNDLMSTSTIPVTIPEEPKVYDTPLDNPPEDTKKDGKPKEIPKWFEDRFGEMTKTNRQLEREKAALVEQNAQLLARAVANKIPESTVPNNQNVTLQPQDIDKLVTERANEIAAQNKFNEECNRIANDGNKEFADFDRAVQTLNHIGLIEPSDKPQTFLQVATTLQNPHKIMHHLANNPDEAARLRSLPPIRLAQELTRLEMKINQPSNISISGAPAPIKPISGSAKPEIDLNDKDLPMDVWVSARRKQREEKRNRR